jgi:hypothetical protein
MHNDLKIGKQRKSTRISQLYAGYFYRRQTMTKILRMYGLLKLLYEICKLEEITHESYCFGNLFWKTHMNKLSRRIAIEYFKR